MTLKQNSAYHLDQKERAKVPATMYFQFVVKYRNDERERYYSEVGRYKIHSVPKEPVLLSDVERHHNDSRPVTIRFKINYETYFGQNLYVVGSIPELGCWDVSRGLCLYHCGSPISTSNGLFSDNRFNWQRDLILPSAPPVLSYHYVVVNEGSQPTIEPGGIRAIDFKSGQGPANYEFDDVWRWSEFAQNFFVKRIFDDISLFTPKDQYDFPSVSSSKMDDKISCVFRAHCAIVGRARSIKVVGSIDALGNWNPAKGVEMRPTSDLQWTATVEIEKSLFPFEYKFVAMGGNDIFVWEPNDNRKATMSKWDNMRTSSCVSIDSWHLSFATGAFHGAGIFVNLNEITVGNCVIDFKSMGRLAEWASRVGFAAVHFIGLFDTTALTTEIGDLPVSGLALTPLYADLTEYGFETAETDRTRVLEAKLQHMRKMWDQDRATYQYLVEKWRSENEWWITGYEKLCFSRSSGEDEVEYSLYVDFVQWLCHGQLRAMITAGRDANMAVGLDLPFALHENSAEALSQPELFMTDYRLGIPPSQSNPVGTVLPAYPYNFAHATKWFAKIVEFWSDRFSILRLTDTINFFRQWIVPRKTCVRAVFGRFEPSVSISYGELETWGLWDIERYTQPYITPKIVESLFGDDKVDIDTVFLEHKPDGDIFFKSQFATEKDLVTADLNAEESNLRSRNLEGLIRLLGEVLLIQVDENEYHPRLQLAKAPTKIPQESYSFAELPSFHQYPFLKIHNEFVLNKQKGLWAANGRKNLQGIESAAGAIILSDATGIDGELCDEALQGVGILPFRAHLEKRTSMSNFDDIRGYPYVSIASPTRTPCDNLREMWAKQPQKRKHLWEDEFYENGETPGEYNDSVAEAMMKLHCWSASMWVMFPIDTLIGATKHLVKGDTGSLVTDINEVFADRNSNDAILKLLNNSKRK